MRTLSVKADEGAAAYGAASAAALALRGLELLRRHGPRLGWTVVSIGFFASIWEILWYFGLADPRLLPPPHVFLGDFVGQARFFNTAQRWEIGVNPNAGPSPAGAVLITILSSTMRVLAGLGLAAISSLS